MINRNLLCTILLLVCQNAIGQDRSSEPRPSFASECDSDDDNPLGELALMVIGIVGAVTVTSPFWGPRSLLHDDSLDEGYFARYPYRVEQAGYLLESKQEQEAYGWLNRSRLEYGTEFDEFTHFGGQVLLDTSLRLGIDSELFYRREETASGASNDLFHGDANLLFRFAQSGKLQMRTGIGINWLTGSDQSGAGFNFTYSGDWFPVKPLIFSSEIDWGTLDDAELFHGRFTGGLHYHRFEFFGGLDYLDIDTTQINSFVSGVRLWY